MVDAYAPGPETTTAGARLSSKTLITPGSIFRRWNNLFRAAFLIWVKSGRFAIGSWGRVGKIRRDLEDDGWSGARQIRSKPMDHVTMTSSDLT